MQRGMILLLPLLIACGGEDESIDSGQSTNGVLTGEFTPTGNGTPQSWTSVPAGGYTAVDDYPVINTADYLESDKTEEHASTIALSAMAPAGSWVTQFQIVAHAARQTSFPGNCLLRIGYKVNSGSIVYGSQFSVSSVHPTYTGFQSNFTVSMTSGSQTISLVVKDDGGENCRVAWKKIRTRYIPTPATPTITGSTHYKEGSLSDGTVVYTTLGWPDVSDEGGYKIEKSENGGSSWTQAGTTGANVTALSLIPASPLVYTAPMFRVSACSGSPPTFTGCSNPSPAVSGVKTPGAFSVSRFGATGAIWSWTGGTDPNRTSYTIEIDDLGGITTLFSGIPANATSEDFSCCVEPGNYRLFAVGVNRLSTIAQDLYVPAPAADYVDPTLTMIDSYGGKNSAPLGQDGTANITDFTISNEQPYILDSSPPCTVQRSINGGFSWTTLLSVDGEVYDDIATPTSTGLQYRRWCWWDGVQSDIEMLYGISAPTGFTMQASGGDTLLSWALVSGANDYHVACLVGSYWAENQITANTSLTLAGQAMRTCHVFARDLVATGVYTYSIASPNVTFP